MKKHVLTVTMWLVAGHTLAEPARTVRPSALQAQSHSDAVTLATLPENTRVDVLRRTGAWSEVKTTTGQSGWVRMLNLRFEGGVAQRAGNERSATNPVGALTGLLSSGRASGAATVTTGVRGLTEEDLQNARANPAELKKMQKFAVERHTAQAFGQRSKLAPAQIEYLTEPAPLQQTTFSATGG
jgi:hypothetical protein